MRTITSSGTLTDTMFPGQTFEVVFCIQIRTLDHPGSPPRVVNIDYVLRKDGHEVPFGPYDLRESVSGELFHLQKTYSGWRV